MRLARLTSTVSTGNQGPDGLADPMRKAWAAAPSKDTAMQLEYWEGIFDAWLPALTVHLSPQVRKWRNWQTHQT
jgi:hypothetical protein